MTAQSDNIVSEHISSSQVPIELRRRVSGAFEGFIGNESAVKRVTRDLLYALSEQPAFLSINYLLTGQPSTGKTEFAKRIAAALNLPLVPLDGKGLISRERLFNLTRGELSEKNLTPLQEGQRSGLPILVFPPLIVFVDEVHVVNRSVQESLLTMLEAADRIAPLNNYYADMRCTTFVFATTRASELDAAFRSRCCELPLREYTLYQVAEIVARKYPAWWPDIYVEIAKLGRLVPRQALSIAEDLKKKIRVSENPGLPVSQHLQEVRRLREIDENGLSHLDLHYLTVLDGQDGPVGEKPLKALLGTADKDRITDEVEPYLIKLGFIQQGPRGRAITSAGRQYLQSPKSQ